MEANSINSHKNANLSEYRLKDFNVNDNWFE